MLRHLALLVLQLFVDFFSFRRFSNFYHFKEASVFICGDKKHILLNGVIKLVFEVQHPNVKKSCAICSFE